MRRPAGKKTLEPAHAADPNAAHLAAIGLLARRDFSSADLARKLTERGFSREAVDCALAELKAAKVLDDARFGQNLSAQRVRRGQGPARIRQELRRAGLAEELIEEAAAGPANDGTDFARLARETRVRKFGPKVPKDWKEKARQARFLQYRGFSTDHIRAALDGDLEVDDGGQPDSDS
jgi:regulatory protein